VRPDPRVAGRLPRRGADRLEDVATWVLMAGALVMLIVIAVVGVGTYSTGAAAARVQTTDRTAVDAVTLADAPLVAGAGGVDPGLVPVLVPVRWTGVDGIAHTGTAPVIGSVPAGQPVTVWLDRVGQPVSAPATVAGAVVQAVMLGGLLLVGGVMAVGLGWVLLRHLVGRLNAGFWEREWARVGPHWTGHGRAASDRESGPGRS
jgi:hypothetical protein